jgi:hypothetical protein
MGMHPGTPQRREGANVGVICDQTGLKIRLTIFLPPGPIADLGKSSQGPQPSTFLGRIFETLLDLNAFVAANELSQDDGVLERRVEGFMASTLLVIYVLTNHLPVMLVKDVISKDRIGL